MKQFLVYWQTFSEDTDCQRFFITPFCWYSDSEWLFNNVTKDDTI